MDTHRLENIGLGHIASLLQRSDILIAKPLFDISGADLLAFATIDGDTKCGRVQVKLRTLEDEKANASVTIPAPYVDAAFFFFFV